MRSSPIGLVSFALALASLTPPVSAGGATDRGGSDPRRVITNDDLPPVPAHWMRTAPPRAIAPAPPVAAPPAPGDGRGSKARKPYLDPPANYRESAARRSCNLPYGPYNYREIAEYRKSCRAARL